MFLRRVRLWLRSEMIRRPMAAFVMGLALAYLCATSVIMTCEGVNLYEAAMMTMPAFLGELGIVGEYSFATQFAILVSLVISVAFLAILTAKITTVFVEFCKRGGSVVTRTRYSNHIIICGWNFQGNRIVHELLHSDAAQIPEVVVLANTERRPVKDERVQFISGDPTQDEDLRRAGVERCDSVIILTDISKGANEADAEALMIVLAVETLNRAAHTSVQILNSVNRVHVERAHADEIICLDQLGGDLVVAAAMNHGVSRVVSQLLTFNSGSEIYRYDRAIPWTLLGKEFAEVAHILAGRRILLLGVETEDSEQLRQNLPGDVFQSTDAGNRVIVVNPQSAYKVRQGDALFLVAESEPAEL